ncbi:HAMP domain-containing sensor histidine kinase [Halorientalis pallida]|uniref:histidine kinase n=1 Tax=Halorientalis pallida TaxID=2479928 RepID=A0A498L105_9EURY|nr:HAMP domain-containing sensor histidine kinase [Halorientalis pallida]RXK51960.1 HAMP domain-containing histidine kinase [Halorientalis pallida]
MGGGQRLREQVRSRYAVKFLAVSLLITAVIVAGGTVIAYQVSDRVTEEQLQSVEASAELEAESLARWFEGEQDSIRLLSAHDGVVPSNRTVTNGTLTRQLAQAPDELVSLHVVERATEQPSNGTTERIVSSTEPVEGEALAATGIDWGQDADGEEVLFQFNDTEEVLVSWVYLDEGDMSVAIASPTRDGNHVLIGEYHPSTRVAGTADAFEGANTVVLGGVSGYVMFEKDSPNEFRPYKGDSTVTEVESRIDSRADQFAPINGSNLGETEVRGYHSVPSDGVNWVVVKEVPRSSALAVTSQVQSNLVRLIALVFVGLLLLGGMIHYGPIRSIRRLSKRADAIASGDLTVEISDDGRVDEVGQLQRSLHKTKSYIETITQQAEKIARREFDDESLDEDIPGPVGEAMVAMRDDLEQFITERERREQRLEVFNRVLRHNLRNRLDVINSHTEQLAEQTDGDHAEAILSETDRLAEISTRARRIDRLMTRDRDPSAVDLTTLLHDLLDDVESDGIVVETDVPSAVTLRTDSETLRTALVSPLENAIKYADSLVTVSVESTPDGYSIVVSDDGPGIPANEVDSLAAGTETDLRHSRGLGLWQLKWGVNALDGELSFENETGTTVRIRLPNLAGSDQEDEHP